MTDVQSLIAALGLGPNPEGGYYAETWSPGFRFEGFELAEPGWEPGSRP